MRFQPPKGDHKISCANLTPLGRVFKIHDFFLHGFIGCLLSVSGMLLWVTPLGVR